MEYILATNNMSRISDLVLGIIDNETNGFFEKIDVSFENKEKCVAETLNNELGKVQQEYSLYEKYDLSQGLNEILKRTLNNYYYIKNEENKSIQKEIMNRELDSYKSVVYEKIKSKLQELGIYNENNVDDIICQIDSKVKADIEAAYDGNVVIDSKLSEQIENICFEKIKTLDRQLKVEKEEKSEGNKDQDKFTAELQSLTIPFDEFVDNNRDEGNKIKENERYKKPLPSDFFK